MSSTPFRPISPFSPSINRPRSVSVLQLEESAPVSPLIRWVYSVTNNAQNAASENITNLKGLAETCPNYRFNTLSPNMHDDLVTKVDAVYQSLRGLVENHTTVAEILNKASIAFAALRVAFPQEARTETPPRVLNFCFSPTASSVTPTKLATLLEEWK